MNQQSEILDTKQPHGVYTKTVSIHNLAFQQNKPFPFYSPFLKE